MTALEDAANWKRGNKKRKANFSHIKVRLPTDD